MSTGNYSSTGLMRLRSCKKVIRLTLFLAALACLPVAALAESEPAELEGQLNINQATVEELAQLPEVDKNQAGAIVEFRRRHGPFKDISVLVASGILGEKSYEGAKPYLIVNGPSDLHFIGRDETGARVLSTGRLRTSLAGGPAEIRLLPDAEYHNALLAAIDRAEHEIDIAMFIFKITELPDNRPAAVAERLIAARKRGVAVKVLLEHSGKDEGLDADNRRTAERLRGHGITVAFDSPRTTTHAKLVVIDDRYVFIGSHNLTHAALAENQELSLLIDNPELARQALAYLRGIR